MITRILLRNFQRHRKLDIRFGRVTTLIGPTDSGKSAIIRALRWVMTNNPRGNSFVKHGAKKCSVTIWADGHKIRRSRAGATNTYWMDGHTYRSFSTGVPEPIQQVLRIKDENFQQQHDPIFWLSLSPPEVSKRLNEIADLQIMDDSIRKAMSIKKEAEHRVNFCTEGLAKAKENKKELAHVPAMLEAWGGLETRRKNLIQNRTDCTRLHEILVVGKSAVESVARLQEQCAGIAVIMEMERKLDADKKSATYLRIGIRCASIRVPSKVKLVGFELMLSRLADSEAIIDKLRRLSYTITQLEKKESQCKSLLANLTDSTSRVSEICPQCGRPMPTRK